MAFVLALDQGTTSSRAVVFDQEGNAAGMAQREFEQIFPRAGWVEHDPAEIWTSQASVITEALSRAHCRPRDIVAAGITNQRETTIVWDRETGEPVYNAIVWQDRRTSAMCEKLRAAGAEQMVRSKTGLVIDAYFSGTKIAWILDNVAGARERAESGKLAFGTVDSWLIWKLTSHKVHATDPSNASRTLLFNIHSGDWDEELLQLLRVPRSMLPKVESSSGVIGEITTSLGPANVPIAGLAGDQQAALFGQTCFTPGMAKTTYGTGCFMLQNMGDQAAESKHKLLTTTAWKIGGKTTYALEGSVFIGGAVVQWLRDQLGVIRSAPEVEALARSVPDNGGVYLVPAFAGLGAPYWDQYARGALMGLTRGSSAGHIARAALEGIAYQVADVLDAMQSDSGIRLSELRVDGGASRNNLLMQFQADILGVPVVRSAVPETTALGAAYLAGLATGFWKTPEEVCSHWKSDARFEPSMAAEESRKLRGRWARAVERARAWEEVE